MNIMALEAADRRRKLKMTILYRQGGTWHPSEVDKLTNGLMIELSGTPQHPEYLVLSGHHTKDETLKALGGGTSYTVRTIIGTQDKSLPFVPGFA